MRLTSTFFTTALISSIAIAAAINEQAPGNEVVSATEQGTTQVSNVAQFESDLNKFIQLAKKYTKNLFNQNSAAPMAAELREDIGKLEVQAENLELSEVSSNQMHFAEYIVDTVNTAADEIKPFVGATDAASWAIRSLIQIKVDALVFQSAPGVLNLQRSGLKQSLFDLSRSINSASVVFRQAQDVSDKTRAQYETHLTAADDLLLNLHKQTDPSM